jgi:hypothetical protein
MSLTAKQGLNIELIEAGNHHGVCVAVIDLGTQYNETFNKEQLKVMITWELPDFPIVDENQELKGYRLISKEYTSSLSEKANLYADLISWRGRDFTPEQLEGFNIKNVLGANCLVNVIHVTKGNKTYANVSAVAKLPKGMTAKEATYKLWYDMDEGVENIPEGIPDWIKDKIKKSKEWMSLGSNETPPDDYEPPVEDLDIPF